MPRGISHKTRNEGQTFVKMAQMIFFVCVLGLNMRYHHALLYLQYKNKRNRTSSAES